MDQSSELRHAWRERKALGVLGGVFGMAIIGVALLLAQHTRASLEGMLPTQGTIIGFGPRGSVSKGPIVEFMVNGQRYEFTDPGQSKTPWFSVGETVEVRYDPERPANARVSAFLHLYLGPIVLGLIGSAFVYMGVMAWSRPPNTGPNLPPARQV